MESENTDLPAKNKGLVWLEQHKVQIGIGVFVAISSIVSITIAAKTGHTPKFKTICNGADKGVATIAKAAEKASLPVVNKRLVSSGMMTKEPWGYKLTEVGKLFGKETVKVTRAGYTFSNIEWDEAVVPFVFTSDELASINAKKTHIAQVIAQ